MSISQDSSRSWAGVRNLTVRSVNSGLESFANSPANSIVDTVYINQPVPVAAMVRTSDWVQEQSTQDQTSATEAVAHSAQPVTPPPRSTSCEKQADDVEAHRAPPHAGQRRSKLVYSIPTLLRMRRMQGAVPVMLRVKPEAIAENIFQYMGAATTRQPPSRSRGLSDMSNVSRGSISSNNIDYRPSIGSKFMNIPKLNRQPPPPIGIPPPLQRHDGFVRFLQQHASPPHHRVTAGGRIVPAGPTSPPPMFDFGSLNDLVRGRLANTDTSQKEVRSVLSSLKEQTMQGQEIPSITPAHFGGHSSNECGTFAGQANFPASSLEPTPYNNALYGYQPLMTPATQAPSAMIPVAVFPDGSTLVSCNGMHYRTYWNGVSTVMEPLQPLQQPTESESFTGYQRAPLNVPQYGFPTQPAQAPNTSGPLANITNGSRTSSNRKTSDSLLAPHTAAKEAAFKQELTNLDKHLALYHFEITPAERTELVAQRRYLVESLDKIRVSKEKDNHSIPIIAPHTGLPITPPTKSTTDQKVEVRGADTQNKTTGKALSPAALPFVPKNTWSGPYGLPEKRTFSDQSTQYGDFTVSKRHAYNESSLNVKDMVNAAIARKAQNMNDLSGSTKVPSHRQCSSSSILDPSDPAMRVIDYEDIEYASRYLYNWGLDKKTYCTTVAEFQEAVRRVRDQARRYGCFGGSSKDPAYDAEQDIWWAICDRDPIPLPADVPDHVINPRPWDWEDSAFNFRRKDAPLPPLSIDNARNSPRLSGWDPITTESMKDRMDVTRSYYAFKGQLPNTPFRTWGYDDAGNKVEIEDPHCLDHVRFQARLNNGKTSPNLPPPAPSGTPSVNKNELASRHLGPNPPNSLRPLNTNEINIRHMTPRFKDGRKMNLTEGDAVPQSTLGKRQPVLTLERTTSGALADAGKDTTTNSKRSSGVIMSHHSYVEDCPETPATRRSGPNVKWGPSPVKTSTSPPPTRHSGSKSKGVRGLTEAPVEEPKKDPTSTPQTFDIDPDMDPIWGGQYPIYDKRNPRYSRFCTSTPTTVGRFELSAETRSPWGPDEGCGPVPYSPGLIASLKAQGTDKVAKVNIPVGAHDRPPVDRNCNASEVKSINVPSFGASSHQFLRKMLKSPTYSSVQACKPTSGAGFGITDRLSKLLRGGDSAMRGTNKENTTSNEKAQDTSSKVSSREGDQSGAGSLLKTEADASISKAPSSLASSVYQAHGYLPQYDGAGKTHTASLRQYQGNEPAPQQVRVNLPSPTSYAGSQTASTPSASQDHDDPSTSNPIAAYSAPVNFGYDGGTDTRPPVETDASKTNSQTHPNFDYKGVTPADYEIQRESPDNEWHRGAVEDFFQEIAANERQEIASAHQSNATDTRTS